MILRSDYQWLFNEKGTKQIDVLKEIEMKLYSRNH